LIGRNVPYAYIRKEKGGRKKGRGGKIKARRRRYHWGRDRGLGCRVKGGEQRQPIEHLGKKGKER